jgi:hypothetical protein
MSALIVAHRAMELQYHLRHHGSSLRTAASSSEESIRYLYLTSGRGWPAGMKVIKRRQAVHRLSKNSADMKPARFKSTLDIVWRRDSKKHTPNKGHQNGYTRSKPQA